MCLCVPNVPVQGRRHRGSFQGEDLFGEGAGERLCSLSVTIPLYFQLGWLISQLNRTMPNSLLS